MFESGTLKGIMGSINLWLLPCMPLFSYFQWHRCLWGCLVNFVNIIFYYRIFYSLLIIIILKKILPFVFIDKCFLHAVYNNVVESFMQHVVICNYIFYFYLSNSFDN